VVENVGERWMTTSGKRKGRMWRWRWRGTRRINDTRQTSPALGLKFRVHHTIPYHTIPYQAKPNQTKPSPCPLLDIDGAKPWNIS